MGLFFVAFFAFSLLSLHKQAHLFMHGEIKSENDLAINFAQELSPQRAALN
jgi:hypothetical protein